MLIFPLDTPRRCIPLAFISAAIILMMTEALIGFCDENSPTIAQALKEVLARQAAAWNRGDIDAFMEDYWKSEKLTFSSGGKTTRGWKTTKENYKRRYPTREQMGKLTFDELEASPLGDSAALVLGTWRLQRKDDSIGGSFSLVFRKIDNRWRIIHDHTSLLE